MAYQTGDTILDDHYNGFANDNSPNNINKIWGTGNADYGYGQSNTISTVSPGTTVTAAQWNTVLDRMQSIKNHQGSSISSSAGTLSGGDTISAILTISSDITTLGTNRLNVAGGNVTLSNGVTGTRTFTSNWNTATVHEVSFTFASVDAARYFFNAGGTLRWNGSISGYTPGGYKAEDWENLLETQFNLFTFGATSSSISGSGTLSTNNASTGYYDLVGTGYNTIFKMFAGQGGYATYAANYVQIDVKTNGTAGSNSANGNVITIKATMQDAVNVGIADEVVTGSLLSNWGYNKPNTTYLNNDAVGTITTAEVSQSQS